MVFNGSHAAANLQLETFLRLEIKSSLPPLLNATKMLDFFAALSLVALLHTFPLYG